MGLILFKFVKKLNQKVDLLILLDYYKKKSERLEYVMNITEFGKELRKLRIERGEKLLNMSKRLGVSASFISSIEIGKKPPPNGFEEKIIEKYKLDRTFSEKLRLLSDNCRKTFTLEPENTVQKDAAALFARRLSSISSEELDNIKKILNRELEDDE